MKCSHWSSQYTFATFFIGIVVVIVVAGFFVDWWVTPQFKLFQRSGALLCLAGLEAQYVKLLDKASGKNVKPISWHDILGMSLIIFGTIIWGYGDLAIAWLRCS